MGTHRTWIAKIERDKATPTVESLFNLSRGLNLSPRFILEMAEAMASA
jgi:transcriptional regulator with XRE-family HTH domain